MGERLYNGVHLPAEWPPRHLDPERFDPMPVPYMENPPDVIPIDVGRQLFVDDFLIAHTTLKRTFHQPVVHAENPVLKPDRTWERESRGWFATPFSGGVWFDPADGLFKMWYHGGYLTSICYATSADGVRWEKPELDVVPGTNIVLREGLPGASPYRDSVTVWLDSNARDPSRRFKYFGVESGQGWRLVYRTSSDGIHWSDALSTNRISGDRSTVFHNPFRDVWVLSQRIHSGVVGRCRSYIEAPTAEQLVADVPLNQGMDTEGRSIRWTGADRLDPHNPDPRWSHIQPQLYNLDAAPYESLMLGFFSVWQGPENGDCHKLGLQKRNDILIGFSRDGFHWDRPNRECFIPCSWEEGSWRFGNVQSVGGGCVEAGDHLYFYFSGRAIPKGDWDADAATGLAVLRRDGFASMDTGADVATLTTRPVTFNGKHLFVNVDCPQGEMRVDVLDQAGNVIDLFSAETCESMRADSTQHLVRWRGSDDLSPIADEPVRFRFHLARGNLYSFWVSRERSGISDGYLGRGTPTPNGVS